MVHYEEPGLNLYHLVIVDSGTGSIVAEENARGWSLPFCLGRASERGSLHVAAYLRRSNLPGSLVYMVPVRHRRGDCQAWHCVVRANHQPQLDERYRWKVSGRLDPMRSLIPGQLAALDRHLAWSQRPPRGARFVRFSWVDDVRRWIDMKLSSLGAFTTGDVKFYRATHREATAIFKTTNGDVCFKAGTPEIQQEAAITSLLSKHHPEHFSRTVAYDGRRQWWLTHCIRGHCLSVTPSARDAARVIETLARIQRDSTEYEGELQPLNIATLRVADFASFVERLITVLRFGNLHRLADSAWHQATVDRTVSALHGLSRALANLQIPASWVHTDIASGNIIVQDDGAIAFIDLEGSRIGIPCLAAQQFAENFEGLVEGPAAWYDLIRDCYTETWAATWPSAQLREVWRLMPAASTLYRVMRVMQVEGQGLLDQGELAGHVLEKVEKLANQVESLS